MPRKLGKGSAVLTALTVLLALALVVMLAPRPVVVVDGDTVDRWPWRHRLAGFDTPETKRPQAKCQAEIEAGRRAARRLEEMIASASRVELTRVTWRRDRWGRWISRLDLDGEDVAQRMIAEGHAVPYSGRGPRHDWCSSKADANMQAR